MAKRSSEANDDDDMQWRQQMLYHQRIRTDLANERKYLGWLRVSLGMTTLGFVVQQLDIFLRQASGENAKALGPLLFWAPFLVFGMGAVMVVVATWEFFADRRRIDERRPRQSQLLKTLVLTTLVGLVLVATILLLLHR